MPAVTPHRAEPLTATITVIIDGVPHSGEVVLSPVAREPKPITALRVVQDAPREHAICRWCEHVMNYGSRCGARSGQTWDVNVDGSCKLYAPSMRTRISRTLRLGRKPVPL